MAEETPIRPEIEEPARRKMFKRAFRYFGVAVVGAMIGHALIRSRPLRAAEILRPPGALPEKEFDSTCIRCGSSVVISAVVHLAREIVGVARSLRVTTRAATPAQAATPRGARNISKQPARSATARLKRHRRYAASSIGRSPASNRSRVTARRSRPCHRRSGQSKT